MSIVVDNISKVYGQQMAVDHVSFKAEKGRILGFMGPNGAGKSTTMKILTCFIPQTSGAASVCGFDVTANPMDVRRNIGYLPEHNPLYLDMYVKEALGFISDLHAIEKKNQRIAEVIELTGLGEEQHKKISALSKGYRQRVGLAQAIIHDPAVLILDEPTTGLDPNQIIGIRQLIRDLGKSKTVIFSTHIMQEVEALCNDVVIINKGRLVANDSIEGLKEHFSAKSLEEIFVSLTNPVGENG
ncbi:ATP-binding cassette domain-containing protein [Flavihumibacter sp. R14]|nr:ATP-binding cassette domain-containing protein [Flavihumibacter soli]